MSKKLGAPRKYGIEGHAKINLSTSPVIGRWWKEFKPEGGKAQWVTKLFSGTPEFKNRDKTTKEK